MARSIKYPDCAADALAQVAETLAQAGRHEQAEAIAVQAESAARWIDDQELEADALAQIAGTLARAGQHQRAEDLASSISYRGSHARALAQRTVREWMSFSSAGLG